MSLHCTRLLSRVSLRQYKIGLTPHLTPRLPPHLTPQIARLSTYHHNNKSNRRGYGTVLVSGAFAGLITAKAKEKEEEEEGGGEEEGLSFAQKAKKRMMKKVDIEEGKLQMEALAHENMVSSMEQQQKVEAEREERRKQEYVEVVLREITPEEYAELDDLYFTNQTWLLEEELFELEKVSPDNDQIYWRLARCFWDLGKQFDSGRRHNTFVEGLKYALKAIEINDNNSDAHRWAAILSDLEARRHSFKEQVMNLERMKYHLTRAIEIDPTNQVNMTLMGMWHHLISEQKWYQRLACSILYHSLPDDASYEEALKYYLKSEQISDKVWNRTLLLAGKTYLKLGNEDKGVEYLKRVSHLTVVTVEDHYIGFEARYILREIEYKNNVSAAKRLLDRILEIPWTMLPTEHIQRASYGHTDIDHRELLE